jgi:hypothetical protein
MAKVNVGLGMLIADAVIVGGDTDAWIVESGCAMLWMLNAEPAPDALRQLRGLASPTRPGGAAAHGRRSHLHARQVFVLYGESLMKDNK